MLLRGTRIIKLSGRQEMLSRTESSPVRRLRASSNDNTGRFFIIFPSFPFAGELSSFLALLSARSVVGSLGYPREAKSFLTKSGTTPAIPLTRFLSSTKRSHKLGVKSFRS